MGLRRMRIEKRPKSLGRERESCRRLLLFLLLLELLVFLPYFPHTRTSEAIFRILRTLRASVRPSVRPSGGRADKAVRVTEPPTEGRHQLGSAAVRSVNLLYLKKLVGCPSEVGPFTVTRLELLRSPPISGKRPIYICRSDILRTRPPQ